MSGRIVLREREIFTVNGVVQTIEKKENILNY